MAVDRKDVDIFAIPKTLPSFFWFFLKPRWGMALLYASYGLFNVVELVCIPYLFSVLISLLQDFSTHNIPLDVVKGEISTTCLLLLAAAITTGVGDFLTQWARQRLIPFVEADINIALLKRVQYYPLTYFLSDMDGKIENRISEMVDGVSDIIELVCSKLLPVVFNFSIVIFSIFQYNYNLGIILLSWVIIHIMFCLIMGKKAGADARNLYDKQNQLSGVIVDSLSNNATKYLFGMQQSELIYLEEVQNEEREANSKFYRRIFYINMVLWLLFMIFIAGFFNQIMCLWSKNILATATVIFIFNSIWNLVGIVWDISRDFTELFGNIGQCLQSLTVVLECEPVVSNSNLRKLDFQQGIIEFKNACVNDRLHNINLRIEYPEIVCIVGKSGAGKSTLLNLINKIPPLAQGEVLIDNQNIAEIDFNDLNKYISNIPQDTSLFNRTIMENILCGRDFPLQAVHEATHKARIFHEINKLGWDFVVGPKGNKLSGGQKQRILLARAFLSNPAIILLDEPFSALDPEAEHAILTTIMEEFVNKTIIFTTHRLLTAKIAHRIILMENGKIAEIGNHQELMERKGKYYELYINQEK